MTNLRWRFVKGAIEPGVVKERWSDGIFINLPFLLGEGVLVGVEEVRLSYPREGSGGGIKV